MLLSKYLENPTGFLVSIIIERGSYNFSQKQPFAVHIYVGYKWSWRVTIFGKLVEKRRGHKIVISDFWFRL
jgi:hypothetical protein